MQIIEQTGFGVRSAVLTFERADSSAKFVVIPMMHLARESFFREVRSRLAKCDVVIVEGVTGTRTRLITLAYRIAGRFRRGGLVTQSAVILAGIRGQVVRPDVSAQEFARGWQGIGYGLRWALLVLAPLFGVWMLIVGPARAAAGKLNLDDLPSPEEEDYEDERLTEALLGSRDRRLLEEIEAQHRQHSGDPAPWLVGVCWGASHVRAIAPALLTLGYHVRHADRITVM